MCGCNSGECISYGGKRDRCLTAFAESGIALLEETLVPVCSRTFRPGVDLKYCTTFAAFFVGSHRFVELPRTLWSSSTTAECEGAATYWTTYRTGQISALTGEH